MRKHKKKRGKLGQNVCLIVTGVIMLIILGLVWKFSPNTSTGSASTKIEIENLFAVSTLESLQKAIQLNEQLVKDSPRDLEAHLILASVYAQYGSISFEEEKYGLLAIEEAEKALKIDRKSSEAYRIIGYANEIMEKYPASIENYNKAIELDPQNAVAYSNRGHSFDLQGDLAAAKTDYLKALEIDPVLDHALGNIAQVYARENNIPLAIESLNTLIASTNNTFSKSDGMIKLAAINMYQDKSKTPDAKQMLLEAFRLNPDSDTAVLYLGWAQYNMIDFETITYAELADHVNVILKYVDIATTMNPHNSSAYLLAATTLFYGNDFEGVVRVADHALANVLPNDIALGVNEKAEMQTKLSSLSKLSQAIIQDQADKNNE